MAGSLFEAPKLEDGDDKSSSPSSSTSASTSNFDFKKCMVISTDGTTCDVCYQSQPTDTKCDTPKDAVDGCMYYNKDGCIACDSGYGAQTMPDPVSSSSASPNPNPDPTPNPNPDPTPNPSNNGAEDAADEVTTRRILSSSTGSGSSGTFYQAAPSSTDKVYKCHKMSDFNVSDENKKNLGDCSAGTVTAIGNGETGSNFEVLYTVVCTACSNNKYYVAGKAAGTGTDTSPAVPDKCVDASKVDNCQLYGEDGKCSACAPGYSLGGDGSSSSTESNSSSSSTVCSANKVSCQAFDGKKCTACQGGDDHWAFANPKDKGYSCSAQVLALAGLIVAGLNFF